MQPPYHRGEETDSDTDKVGMKWFKNLQTKAKLMLGFGFLSLLMGVVGYQGLSGMSTINDKLARLYQRDMRGLSAIQDVATTVAMIGRQTRGAVIDTDTAAIQKEKDKVEALFLRLDAAMAITEQTFITERGKALVTELKPAVPEYRSICTDTIRLSLANDKKAAVEVLSKAAPVGDRINNLVQEATDLKQTFGREAFEESAKTYQQARTTMVAIILGSIAFALALGYFIGKLIAAPLHQTVEVLELVASGDLTRSLDVSTADEVGHMAKGLNAAVEGIREALTEVRGAADNLASASQQLAAGSEQLSSGAQEQASSLEETTASLEEITASVRQNADSAKQANQLAAAARDTAEKGGQVVTAAVSAIGDINTSSKKIADIITAIDEIAFQTNLLALNAAVEAARAGEQGRGFAVVAAEVRNLAQRSATAAKEIKALIQDSVHKVEAGSQMVNQSGDVLLEIVSSVKRVSDIVGEIAAASREQSLGIDQVSKAMSQMDQVTQQNAAQTEELSSTAQGLSSSAEQLQGLVARFRLENERNGRRTTAQPQPAQSGHGKPAATARVHSKNLRNLSRHVDVAAEALPLGEANVPAGSGGGFEEF
jgi:methyl-accepting chemotaxis protein